MSRGPVPLPDNVHQLRGNPSKKRLGSTLDGRVHPVVRIPACPKHVTGDARAEWRRITKDLEQLGLICNIDRAMLVGYCQAWAEVVQCEKKIADLQQGDPKKEAGLVEYTPSGYRTMSVWVQIRNRAYERLKSFAAEFGMSPSQRSRVQSSELRQGDLPGMERPHEPQAPGWQGF